jgi:hypothetical protein
MAIYTTFFLCESDRLQEGFPGWKPPLAQAVTREWVHPFTREKMTVSTREPEWDDFDPEDVEPLEYRLVSGSGDYATYLEGRIPAFVRSLPHWCAKNLTSLELQPLMAAVTGNEEQELETSLYAHPSSGATLEEFPHGFVSRLKSADGSTLLEHSREWAAAMSAPEYTHSVDGERVYEDWSADDALSNLSSIAELARKQDKEQSMYLLTEA